MKNTAPKHKIALIVGLLLFVASPLLLYVPYPVSLSFFLFRLPQSLVDFLCRAKDMRDIHGLCGNVYSTSIIIFFIVLAGSVLLMLWALRVNGRQLQDSE